MSADRGHERDFESGLLSAAGLDRALDAELARCARHELPISFVVIELTPSVPLDREQVERAARAAGAAIERRIRAEDRAARTGPLRFAVMAVETADSTSLASSLADQVSAMTSRLEADTGHLSVAVGAADCQYDELARAQLVREAERALDASRFAGRSRRSLPSAPRGAGQRLAS